MQECPRRTVLGGVGATMAAALAGSTIAETDAEGESPSNDSTFEEVVDYLPASVATDSIVVTATDYDSLLEADQPHDPLPTVGMLDIDAERVSKSVVVASYGEEFDQPIKVLSGDVELDDATESRETDSGIEYEYDSHDADEETVLGIDDEVLVIAESVETIEAAFDANAGNADRLLESESAVHDGFGAYEGSDLRTVQVGDDQLTQELIEDATHRYITNAQTVLDSDTIEVSIGIEFEDESEISDELVETLEAEFAYTATHDDPDIEVDGSFVAATIERDLAAERAVREHDSPGLLRVDHEIDPEDDLLEIELGRGDPTPVEDLTLELDEETYDRDIWAEGHGKLEEGDTIVVEMDDIEPNLSVQLRHDHEMGGSSSGTTILSNFHFDSQFDVDSGELTLTYLDEFPLEGDRLHVAAYDERPSIGLDEDKPEPRTSAEPWEGETISGGETATLEGVETGDEIIIGWDGTDQQDAIGQTQAQPPGNARFEYDYESESLEVTLEFGHPQAGAVTTADGADVARESEDPEPESEDVERSATEYEILIDGEPADTQWSDEFETLSSGATIEVDGVSVGSEVEVVWADTETRVGFTRPQPSVALEYDDGTIEHAGGDALPADNLVGEAWTDETQVELEIAEAIDGDFDEGDTFTVDEVVPDDEEIATIRQVTVQYDEQHQIGFVTIDQ